MKGFALLALALGAGWFAAAPPPPCPPALPPLGAAGLRLAGRSLDTWWSEAALEGEVPAGTVALLDPLGNLAGRLEGKRLVLPTAPRERTAARLLRTGDIVILQGDGSASLEVLLLPPGANLYPGDMFVTHPVGGMPGGLAVARAVAGAGGVRVEGVAFLSRAAGLAAP